jgi:hypothetical protein
MSNNLLRIHSFNNFPREVNLLELDFIIQGYYYKYLSINNRSESNLFIKKITCYK